MQFVQSPQIMHNTLGISRALSGKLDDLTVSLTDFGAMGTIGGDTQTKDNNAMVQAISVLQGTGERHRLLIPEGDFKIVNQVVVDTNDGKPAIDWVGYGSKNSRIIFNAASQAAEYPMLTFRGGDWGTDEIFGAVMEGIGLRTWGGVNHAGVVLNKIIGARFEDVELMNFALHLRQQDLVVASFKKVGFLYGSRGIVAAPGPGAPLNGSAPNEQHFDTCSWIANGACAIDMTGSGNIKITGGSFEGCGHDTTNFAKGSRYAARYNDMGYNAAGMVTYDTVHHEGNAGTADVWIQHNQRPGSYVFLNTDFTRNGLSTVQADNHILFDTTGLTKASVVVKGGGSMVVNGYTPSTATPVFRYGTIVGNKHVFSWEDFVFESAIEKPTMLNGDLGPKNPVCMAVFNGASVGSGLTGVSMAHNLASITKIGTGDYSLNFARQRPNETTVLCGSVVGDGYLLKIGESTSVMRFQTRNLSGVPTDFSEINVMVTGPLGWLDT